MAGHTTLLNTCVIPDRAVAAQCVSFSQGFDDAIVRLKLGDGLFPHATIYMASFEYSSLPAARNTLQETISRLILSGYYQTPGQYIEVSYQRTERLLILHHQIVQAIKRYHKPREPKYESFWGAYDDQQQRCTQPTYRRTVLRAFTAAPPGCS